jgi:hypothetical protein
MPGFAETYPQIILDVRAGHSTLVRMSDAQGGWALVDRVAKIDKTRLIARGLGRHD